ncbi:bifunctional alpha/beta hydrolase/class I SAM-dependent methyltransferase [Fusobacterium ulcerans]|uniref:bifunctional alpha/beta hydrolase/class I SAM-dependent methyltransferase n=1 Tax=Fusobacterium ulcerans TaxID=861 RepID=UPI001032A177|nr:alpha/beta fold hydrolase [Fusobacterium ulcerans]
MEMNYFKSFDNADIFYRSWNFDKSKKTLVVIHRGHEHSERLNDFASNEKFKKYNIFSYDLRGHGCTKEKSSPVFMDYVRDLNSFVSFIKKEYKISEKDIFVVANSIGGVILTAWVHDYAPEIAGMALLAPAFEIKLYVPLAKESIIFLTKLNKNAKIPSYVKSRVLTHDENEQKKYDSDRLITKDINARLLVDLLDAGKRLADDSAAIEIPTIIFSAGKDYVVKNNSQKKFYLELGTELKEFIYLKDFYHGIMFEEKREEVYKKIDDFIIKSYSLKKEGINILPEKFSQKEYETILLKMIPVKEKISFGIQKFLLNKLGWLSKGMSVGLEHGFDSGPSLDYIYKNQAAGKFGVGKFMDRCYLNEIGWRGIRERKKNLLELVRERITSSAKNNVKILDIAGGVGNYLFDIKRDFPDVEIIINEFKKENIAAGEKVIEENKWENIRFTNLDCFDFETYKKLEFTPDIIIISGIFELFNENELINRAVKGASEILEKNGCIIYTGQPWHPQLHKIAFVLNNHREGSWIMRRRSQKELDNIFRYNGLEKRKMLIDNFGIFTVSLGEKRGE